MGNLAPSLTCLSAFLIPLTSPQELQKIQNHTCLNGRLLALSWELKALVNYTDCSYYFPLSQLYLAVGDPSIYVIC